MAIGALFLAAGLLHADTGKQPAVLFQGANEAYRAGDYAHAVEAYESLLAQGWKKADVYYNLGNAYFKLKRVGPAILNYGRVKQLRPRDWDAAANLAFVRGGLEYRMEDRRNWYLKTAEAFINFFTREEIVIAMLTAGLFFWMSWTAHLFFRPQASWGWWQKLFLALTLVFSFLWLTKEVYARSGADAVVLKNQAPVRYGPSYKDQVAFRLPEGIKVRAKKKLSEWSQVALVNGEEGWMLNEEIGMV